MITRRLLLKTLGFLCFLPIASKSPGKAMLAVTSPARSEFSFYEGHITWVDRGYEEPEAHVLKNQGGEQG